MDYHKEYTKLKIMLEATDPMNPDVSVDGLGTYDLNTLKSNTIRNIESLLERAKAGEWNNVKRLVDVIRAKALAIIDTHDALEAKRRKGGPTSRGIDKQ